MVKPKRLGDRKVSHGIGGEIRWHPCFFWSSDLVEIMVKPYTTYLFCYPSDLGWIMVNPSF